MSIAATNGYVRLLDYGRRDDLRVKKFDWWWRRRELAAAEIT
jgi:hypothetical protein